MNIYKLFTIPKSNPFSIVSPTDEQAVIAAIEQGKKLNGSYRLKLLKYTSVKSKAIKTVLDMEL
jgi:hypothetical protein